MEKSKSSLLSSSIFCVRQMVLRVGFKFKLTMARVRTPAPSRLLLALLAGYGVQAMALPTGGQVASGNVTIAAPAGGSLNITQTTDKGIINWQTFNVGSGEKVNFLQPSASSSTLNRVVGNDASTIFGQINANGQVFLINTSGILFAPGAQVNAAGLVASTLQLQDSDYLSGNYSLTGSGGSVDNQGVIKAGFVALAGAQVSNTGTIVADGGTAALAAGGRVTLNLIGSDLVSVSVDAPTAAALVHSGGIVQADGGQVIITAKAANALLDTVVNVDGIVQAHSIGSHNGVITLDGGGSGVVNVSGTLDASGKGAGQTGGTVKVLGADVGLFNATVDASGDAGGGVVRVGGDWHGAGADGDANASQVYLSTGSTIKANATGAGNGGNVVVWSDDRTQFFGAIDARGGASGGNGGQVETSGHVLQAAGTVDASAKSGKGGTWLLDPVDVNINSTGPTDITNNAGVFTSSAGNSTILDTGLGGALTGGTSIEVQTSNATGGNGDITVSGHVASSLTGTQTATLSLEAIRNISFTGGSITSADGTGLIVNLNAGTNSSNLLPGTNASTITMDAASSINLGTAASSALNVTAKGAIQLSKIGVGGNLTVASNGFAVTQESTVGNILTVGGTTSIDAGAAPITIDHSGNVLTGAVSLTNSGAHGVTLTGSGSLTLGTVSIGSGTNTINAGSAVGDSLTRTAAITAGSPLVLNVGGTTVAESSLNTFFASGSADSVTLQAAASGQNLTATGVSVLPTLVVGGDLTVTAATGSAVSQSGDLTVGGNTTVNAGAHGIDLSTGINNFTGSVALNNASTSTENVAVTAAGALQMQAAVGTGTLTVVAAGDITQSGVITQGASAGAVSFTAGANAIALTQSNNFTGVVSLANSSTHDVTLTNANSLTLGTVNIGDGINTINAGSAVGDTLTRTTTLTSGAGIALNVGGSPVTSGSLAGFFAAGSADSVTLEAAAGAVQNVTATGVSALPTLVVGGDLTVTAATGSAISQSGNLTVGGDTTVNAGAHGIDLSTGINNFTGSVALNNASTSTENVAVTAAGALQMQAAVGTGTLTVVAAGDITQSGVITQGASAGAVSFTAGAHAITLTQNNDFTGVVSLANSSTHDVTLTNANSLTLGTINIGDGTNTINAGSAVGDSLTRTAAITAGTPLVLNVGGTTVAESSLNTFFASGSADSVTLQAAASGQNLTATGVSVLPTLVVGGDLTVTAATGSAVSQSGDLTVGGNTTVNAGAHGIDLSTGINNFTGSVALNNASTSTENVAVTAAGALQMQAAVGTGTLTVVAAGDITQSGVITQGASAGAVSFTAGAHAITLTQNNAFTGAVSLNNSGVSAVSITDVDALVLGTSSVGSGLLTVTAGGDITQAGDLAVGGASTLNAGSHDVVLARTGNTFTGLVSATGTSVSVAATGNLDVNALTGATGNLALSSTGTLTGPTAVSTSGDISLTSGTGFTTGGTLSGNDVTLAGGPISIVNNITALGNLVLNSTGVVTQDAASTITAHGTSTLTAGASSAITLTDASNDFIGAVTANGGAVTLVDANALTAHLTSTTSASLTAGGTLTVDGKTTAGDLTVAGAGVTFGTGTTTVNGTLGATSTGTITQSGAVAVTGLATLSGSSAITLANGANDFGTVAVSGGAVSLTDANAMTVHLGTVASGTLVAGGALTVDGATGGALAATGNGVVFGTTTVGDALAAHSGTGTISQTGTLAVAGTSTLDAGTNAIVLGASTNDFGGAVTVNGGSVNLVDANALTVHLATAGDTTLNAAGTLTVDGTSTAGLSATGAGVAFGTGPTHVAGALVANSGTGAITQSGALVVGGASTLAAGAKAITLTNAGNDFTGGVSTTGGVISLTVANALAVHLVNSTSETLNAGGVLSVDGSTTGAVTANGNGVVFGATSIGGALASASGTGTLTQTGPLAVSGTTTLNAGANAITLTNAANDFAGAVTAAGGAVSLTDANALTAHVSGASAALTAGGLLSVDGSTTGALAATGAGIAFGAGTTTVHGALTATSTGAITQSGDLVVNGTTAIAAAGQAVTLDRQTNQLGGAVTVAAAAVDIEQAGALTAHLNNVASAVVESGAALAVDGASAGNLTASGASVAFGSGTTSVGGNLAATSSGGDITQAGTLAVTGTSALAAGTGNVNLGATGNALAGAVTAAGASVTLADQAPLTVHVAANGSATLTSAGALSVDGSSGAMTLNGTAVSFGAAGTTVSGALAVTSTGIAQAGSLAVTGATQLNAGAGAIALDAPGTNLQGTINATGGAIRIVDTHAIDAALNATGDVVLSSGADVAVQGTFQGGLKVAGANVSVNAGTGLAALGATSIGGLLDVASSGNTTLGNVSANGATLAAGGSVLLGGRLTSSSDVTITGKEILGVATLGQLDVTDATAAITLDTRTASGTGGGNIGKAAATVAGAIDADSVIALVGTTGQHGIGIYFNPGQSAWFRVTSQTQTHQLIPHQPDTLNAQTFFCDTQTCVNVLGQTTAIADSVISNILSAASQDAADAAFGTENLDFAIRKGYVTTIGRVPPGIDEIAGDLGATQCDSRVTSPTAIAADKACSAGK